MKLIGLSIIIMLLSIDFTLISIRNTLEKIAKEIKLTRLWEINK